MAHGDDNQITRMRELLRFTPRPLIHAGKKIIILWSPKSACTTTYVWFSHLAGFIDDVAKHPTWPHRHRMDVYMQSDQYWQAIDSDTSDFLVVRILRDPYSRAISIFRHVLKTGVADDFLAREGLDFEKGVSFRQFLDVLAMQEMDSINGHMHPQIHRLEGTRKPDVVINISTSDMFEQINALEQRMDWPVTDFEAIEWLDRLESRRRNREPSPSDNMDEVPLVRTRPRRNTQFPAYYQLLSSATRSQIERIYQEDFEAYRDYL